MGKRNLTKIVAERPKNRRQPGAQKPTFRGSG